jgi:hypothetical protein
MLLGEIDTPSLGIFADIPEDVGQLKGKTTIDCGLGRKGRLEFPNVKARQSDGRRDQVTVMLEPFVGVESRLRLVCQDTVDDFQQESARDAESGNDVANGREDLGSPRPQIDRPCRR